MAVITRSKSKKRRSSKTTPGKLRLLNFVAAGGYALQAVLILILSNSNDSVRRITTGYIVEDKAASAAGGDRVIAQANHLLFDFNLTYLAAAVLFVGAVAHLFLATRYRRAYDLGLKNRVNKVRWVTYSMSLGLIMITVALLSGIFDLSSLLMIFALTTLIGIMGLLTEKSTTGSKNFKLLTYIEGLKFGLLPWIVIFIYIWGAHAYGGAIPAFVYFIYLTALLLFTALVLNFYLQTKNMGRWEDYLFSEKAFIVISFLGSSAISWQIFAGTLR